MKKKKEFGLRFVGEFIMRLKNLIRIRKDEDLCGKSEFRGGMNMQKKWTQISLLTMGAITLIAVFVFIKQPTQNKQETKREIIWITEAVVENIQDELEKELNSLLEKKNQPYKVKFVCFPAETYEEDVASYLEENSADIIYSNLRVVGDYTNQYYNFYKNGYLAECSRIKEDKDFYNAYPEQTWKNMEINGEIYGVPAYCNAGNGLYYVFNQAYLDKYQIDISQVTHQLDSVVPILREVAEKEHGNSGFIPLLPYEYMVYAPGYSAVLDMIQVKEKDGVLVAQNILKNEEIRNSVFMFNMLREEGLLKEPEEKTIENGNFFITIMYGDDPKFIQEYFNQITEEAEKPELSLTYKKLGEHYTSYRTGGMNSVLQGKNEEQALELLKLTVTDKEISHLLKYGNENVPIVPPMLRWMFGNDSFDIKKKEDNCSEIAGFQFDGSGYKAEIDEISKIFYQYSNLFRGFSENVESDYENMLSDLQEKGVDDVLAEVNRQLEEWGMVQ